MGYKMFSVENNMDGTRYIIVNSILERKEKGKKMLKKTKNKGFPYLHSDEWICCAVLGWDGNNVIAGVGKYDRGSFVKEKNKGSLSQLSDFYPCII